jgi:hypothetical protein
MKKTKFKEEIIHQVHSTSTPQLVQPSPIIGSRNSARDDSPAGSGIRLGREEESMYPKVEIVPMKLGA